MPTETVSPVILYFVAYDWYFLSHRLPMANAAREAGFKVKVATCDTGRAFEIEAHGFEFIKLDETKKADPISLFTKILKTRRILKQAAPDIVHNIALKPIVLTGIAASLLPGMKQVHAITGLGSAFTSITLRHRFLQRAIGFVLKRLAARETDHFLLQNADDKNYLISNKVLNQQRTLLIRGSGVDTTHFQTLAEPNAKEITIGYAGRMIKDKGLVELRDAHRALVEKGLRVNLLLAGKVNHDNGGSFSAQYMRDWASEERVIWLGEVEDIRTFWQQCHIAVLPSSYGEGIPKALLEAAACGRAIIATDMPGCREVAINGENALTVPPRNAGELANAIEKLAMTPALRRELAKNSRPIVLSDMSADAVGAATLAIYKRLLRDAPMALPLQARPET